MKPMRESRARTLVASLACALATACASGPQGPVASATNAQATATTEIDKIIALLDQGKAGAAKKSLSAGLKKDPNNPTLMVLRDSMTREPRELLGPDSYRYTAQPGDTMLGLAQRFLGNRLKFYQLSRYNGIDQPSSLRAGQVLEIPGQPPARPAQAAERRPAPPEKSAPAARREPKAVAVRPAPPQPPTNSAAAQQARSAGLAALNGGQPARAVGLLARAASLDPNSAVIARDLARARRIAASVAAK